VTVLDHLLAFALAVGFPVFHVLANPKVQRAIEAGEPGRKVRDYWHTLFELWFQGLAVAALWVWAGREWWELGLWQPEGWAFWLMALGLVALGLFGVYQYRAVRESESTKEQLRARMAYLEYLLPASPKEVKLFSALSVSAGVCEEIAYRGFLIWYFLGWSGLTGGLPGAVVLSSVAFGLAHLYLGWRDALRSAATGAVLAGVYLASGTLWLAIALHAMIDLNSGAIGWAAFGRKQ